MTALERYNFPLFVESGAFDRLISARNKCFRKKILLVNLRDAPLNAHMERAFVRAVAAANASGKSVALDVLHYFANDYGFIGRADRTGFRVKYSGMSNLKDFAAKTKYDTLVMIDLPYGDEELVPYAWLALRDRTPEKFFIANDILLPRGSIFGMDLAEDLQLLKKFSGAYILNQHSERAWGRFGLPKGRVYERDLAVDCVYYDGRNVSSGDYAYSCGSSSRKFEDLLEAVRVAPPGLKLKIYTGLKPNLPADLNGRVEFVPYTPDSSRMKHLIAGAKFVILPIRPDKENPCAGLTVALMSMAMKKVVLTAGNPYMHRYLRDGINAFTYAKLSSETLVRGIKRILSLSRTQRNSITDNARDTVLRLNNMDSFVSGFIKRHCG